MLALIAQRVWLLLLLIAVTGFTLGVSTPAGFAESVVLTAPRAHDLIKEKEMILLDIRTPEEWAETGLAEGAWPVSMHERDFGKRFTQLLQTYRPDQIGLICATGGRSTRLVDFLASKGIPGVVNVPEGMFGNGKQPGWVARNLPMATLDAAFEDYRGFEQQLDP